MALLALPLGRHCEVSHAIGHREVYRQSILVVEREVAKDPMCQECTVVRGKPRGRYLFPRLLHRGRGKCAECLRQIWRKSCR